MLTELIHDILVCGIVLLLLFLVVLTLYRFIRLRRYKNLLPYSDICDQVENMNIYFSKQYVNRYIVEYFKDKENLQSAIANRDAMSPQTPSGRKKAD